MAGKFPFCNKTFKLNTGTPFPAVGLGTWQGTTDIEERNEVRDSIVQALKAGYRLLDTAEHYGVESIVGEAVRDSGIPREEITIVTKLWGHFHSDPTASLELSLKELGMDYVDVLLMHWPNAISPDGKYLPKEASPTHVETWKLMEKLVGPKCRAIGVSNYTQLTLEELARESSTIPAINQVELHACNANHKMVDYCQEKGIVVMSWSTLGGQMKGSDNPILSAKLFKDIAEGNNCSVGQVSLAWAVQRGITVIPKSGNPARIDENIHLPTLSNEDMKAMNDAEKTVGRYRLAERIEPFKGKHPTKGDTIMSWSKQDFGWEDQNGVWLT